MRFFGLLVSALATLAAEDPLFLGPTELQDTFLPAQVRYQSYAESATVLSKGDWRVNVTADWTAHLAQTTTYLFDGESVSSTIKVRNSPLKNWEFGLDIPYTVRLSGVADEFIEYVETTLNAKVDARYALPRDRYNAYIAGPTGTALTLKKGRAFQDMTVRAKYQLLKETNHWIDLSTVATLSLPTGGNTFGGEGFSPGLGLHWQKPLRHFNFFSGGSGNYYSDSREQNFELNELRGMAYGGFEVKPFWWAGLVVMYQVYSPLTSSNPPLNEVAHYYSVMGRFWLGRKVAFEGGVVENVGLIENRNSSDVTVKFALTAQF